MIRIQLGKLNGLDKSVFPQYLPICHVPLSILITISPSDMDSLCMLLTCLLAYSITKGRVRKSC